MPTQDQKLTQAQKMKVIELSIRHYAKCYFVHISCPDDRAYKHVAEDNARYVLFAFDKLLSEYNRYRFLIANGGYVSIDMNGLENYFPTHIYSVYYSWSDGKYHTSIHSKVSEA